MERERWKVVSDVVDAVQPGRRQHVPLSEDDLAKAAVSFANRATFGRFLTILYGVSISADAIKPEGRPLFDQVTTEEFKVERAQLIADLDAVASGAALSAIAKRLTEDAGRMALIPHFNMPGRKLHIRHYYLPETLQAGLAYVTLLFLDESRPYGATLCRCKLDGCGKFFWERRAKKGGKPGRSYCKREHMLAFNEAHATERVRKYRQKQRRVKRKGKAK